MSEHPVGPGSWSKSGLPRPGAVRPIGAEALVVLLEGGLDRVVLIDSRPFVDYNASHILEAVNVNCSKLMKRRLQQDKVQINELLQHSAKKKLELQVDQEVVVYDQSSSDPSSLGSESFLSVLLLKLEKSFPSVHLLSGGFSEFSHLFPGLCEGKSALVPSCISQPCLPITNIGPTRILPHLYLGCQRDVLNKDLMQQNDIGYVLNASNTCPKPDFIPESHFLRVPVNDSFCEKILPWLDRSVEFIEKAKASNARVLVHCLAGISRSATIAIAYIMKRMDMSLDEAYRFVKEKRPTISPNFNFLGQLLDFEKKIKSPHGTECKLKSSSEVPAPPDDPEPPPCPLSEACGGPGLSLLEPLTLPCVLADAPEERLLAAALSGLQLADGPEDNARLKRSFSLDIKSYGEPGGNAPHRVFVPHGASGDAGDFYKPSTFKEPKPCQFSPGGSLRAVHAGAEPRQGGGRRPGAGCTANLRQLHQTSTCCSELFASAAPQRQHGGERHQLPVRPVAQPAAPRQAGLGRRPEGLAFRHPAGPRHCLHLLTGRWLVPLLRLHALLLHLGHPGRRQFCGVWLRSRPGGGAETQPAEDSGPRRLEAELARREQLRETAEETELPDGVWRRHDGQPERRGRRTGQLHRQHGGHPGLLRLVLVLVLRSAPTHIRRRRDAST
ncbi:Dual specificity protein phosphatase 16 [Collichthys lucidus]|uniref:Dual specificity protein phosphatase 16 n=1 Tax=Collichthys lucidus TaxID=240159 RepID=A0A4U5VPF9_COLLU|nr:Dual specificity protein phosphatase 16 [Collichthys lucidus]